MNKLSMKIISVMLILCMVLPIIPIWAMAEEIDSETPEVGFKLEMTDETRESVNLTLSLTGGSVSCFDVSVTQSDEYSCESITFSKDVKNFMDDSSGGIILGNPETGKFSFANSDELVAPIEVVTIKFAKKSVKGALASDFTFTFDTCYTHDENNQDINVVPKVENTVPVTHSHTSSGVEIEYKKSTCKEAGENVTYCTVCDEIAQRIPLEKLSHTVVTDKKDATCTEDGYVRKYCSACKEEFSNEKIEKLAHCNAVFQHKDATCTENGYDRFYCPDCNTYFDETVIPATNHKNMIHQHEDATCTKAGYDKDYCPDCGEYVNDVEIPAINHKNMIHQHEDATCTKVGYDRDYCPDCGEYFNVVEISAINHKNMIHQHEDATCTKAGYDRDYCPDCNEYFNVVEIPATNHKNITHQHEDATCTKAGYDRDYCPDCGEYLNVVEIPATNHKNMIHQHKDSTCKETGYDRDYCPDCDKYFNETIIPLGEHINTSVETVPAKCLTDGYIKTVCDDCNTVIKTVTLPATGHKYVESRKNPTCTEDGYIMNACSACGDVKSKKVIKSSGHSWSGWKVIKPATYRSTGIERNTCRVCGNFREREIPMVVVKVEKLIIVPENDFKIYVKKKDKLQVNVYPEEAAYSAEIVWESSDPKVVSVDENGNITALKRGTATITAKTADGKISATRKITVEYSTVQWIIIYLLFGWIWYL